MVECTRCGTDANHEAVDPLITVPRKVAYACENCDIVFRA